MTSSLPDAAPNLVQPGGSSGVTPATQSADVVLMKAEWLPVLFAKAPTRASLLELRPSWPLQKVSVRVHRNLSCEFISSVAAPYLAFADFEVNWIYGGYDDSLAFAESGNVDVELVWLDYSRFPKLTSGELVTWLTSRLADLRSRTRSPILINGDIREESDLNRLLLEAIDPLPGVHVCNLANIREETGEPLLDVRNQKVAGLPYSNIASVLIARQLGCRWLPGVLSAGIKAIVLDLDQTLYAGVLGEDGPLGLRLSDAHLQLQRTLLRYRDRGIFLAICSRNEPEDVWAMFSQRPDMVLRPEHLSAHSISWDSKALGLQNIAGDLRIGVDSMLFVDDNAGELASIATQLEGTRFLHAGPDPNVTRIALRNFPGLHKWRDDKTDELRIADLAATAKRLDAASEGFSRDYLKSLHATVGFRVSLKNDAHRLQELSGKTNQFNLRLSRFDASDVAQYISSDQCRAVGVELADRLSDSGLIAAVFTRVVGDDCYVDEVCVSCRALGRGLEDLLVLGAVRAGFADGSTPAALYVSYAVGPRNGPALQWLRRLTGEPLNEENGVVSLDWTRCSRLLEDIEPFVNEIKVQVERDT
jgi:FkbH-like protein